MKSCVSLVVATLLCLASSASASVFLPKTMEVKTGVRSVVPSSSFSSATSQKNDLRSIFRQRRTSKSTAMAIPGYGVAEQVFVGGFQNFLSIYNAIITVRILLSWFPQAQGIGALQPVYAITDPYLNLFRGLIPPIFGLDLSPILAFFLLSTLGNATAAVGCEIPSPMSSSRTCHRPLDVRRRLLASWRCSAADNSQPSMNY